MIYFDDYLKLLERDLSRYKLIVFSGVSGSGKSTYIDAILKRHSFFKTKKPFLISDGRPLDWNKIDLPQNSLVVVDELMGIGDLKYLYKLLKRGNQVLCANHLPNWAFSFFKTFYSTKNFLVDSQTEKLKTYLSKNNISFTDSAIEDYFDEFRANYTDLGIILEQGERQNFDQDFKHFKKFKRIEFLGK